VKALIQYGFKLPHSEIVSSSNPADQKWIFRLPDQDVIFQFGPEEYRFTKVRLSWSDLGTCLGIMSAASEALGRDRTILSSASTLRFSMHVQSASRTSEELLAPLVPPAFRLFSGPNPIAMGGTMARVGDIEILVEKSAMIANGIFVRLVVTPSANESIDSTIDRTRTATLLLLQALGLQEQGDA